MKRLAPLIFFLVALLPQAALSQGVVVYERWTLYRQVVVPLKLLPPGYHHFRPVPERLAALRIPSEGNVLCNSLESVVAFGKRLWLGFSPDQAIEALKKARGSMDCGYMYGLTLAPVEDAVRGDDEGRRIFIVKVVDQYGRYFLAGIPKT